jgi:hypothetical protein
MWNFDSSETCVHHVTYNYKESAYISVLEGDNLGKKAAGGERSFGRSHDEQATIPVA